MHILITGAAGFIGQLVARELLTHTSHTVTLADITHPGVPADVRHPKNAHAIQLDLCDAATTHALVPRDLGAVFAFHGIMSAGSEADFDLGMRANVDATRNLLESVRKTCPGARFIYASSCAVYGLPLPDRVDEGVTPTPQSSYGAAKLIGEVLVNEYTRRGFVDGLSLRFPTITVRPGRPTAAASSFLSGMIREPMSGKVCVLPVVDRGFRSWLCSPRVILANLMFALEMDTKGMAGHVRRLNMPGISVTVQEMMDALERVGGKEKLALLEEKDDPELGAMLRSWATRVDDSLAVRLGFQRDVSFEAAVRDYVEDLKAKA